MSNEFENGVDHYVSGVVIVNVHFPNGHIKCKYCPCCKYERAYDRYSCSVTGEWLLEPMKGISRNCPVVFEKEE